MSENKMSKKNVDSMAMTGLKEGSTYYSDKPDRSLTALAVYYGRKIKTKNVFLFDPNTLKVKKVVEVRIIK